MPAQGAAGYWLKTCRYYLNSSWFCCY